jgi:putative phosphoribosyl transferase
MFETFRDRTEAGKKLSDALRHLAGDPSLLVLALPRGGVPVAAPVAGALNCPLEVLLVRKIGAPGRPEFAIGAIASGGIRFLDQATIAELDVSEDWLASQTRKEQAELERQLKAFRGDHPFPTLSGRTVVLVDDGLATGSTMIAAVRAVRQQQPKRLIVAVPVAPADLNPALRDAVDELVILHQPADFRAVGRFYRNFNQTSDEEVKRLLEFYRNHNAPQGAQ